MFAIPSLRQLCTPLSILLCASLPLHAARGMEQEHALAVPLSLTVANEEPEEITVLKKKLGTYLMNSPLNNADIAHTHHFLGKAYINAKNPAKALPYFEHVVNNTTDAEEQAEAHCYLGKIHYQRQEVTQAEEHYEKAYDHWKRTLGSDDPKTKEVKHILNHIFAREMLPMNTLVFFGYVFLLLQAFGVFQPYF